MNKGLRRVAAVAVAALVVAPALATAASATPTFAFDRLSGINRYETSVKVAETYGNSTSVILANGDNRSFPDALTASYLAGEKKAPILLTKKDSTPANVLARITASGATTVYLVGGTGVISAAQAAALDVTFGTVTRLGGDDRYLTAKAVIEEAGAATSTMAILATGKNFPDAIAGGPLSYVKGMPLAITETNTLPDATLAALKTAKTTKVIVLGGVTVVSPAVLATLATNGITVDQRIAGANRSETSSLLAEYMVTSQDFSKTGVNVASGYARGGGADALAGGPLSGKENVPTLITESVTNVGPGPIGYLKTHAATLANGHIFGGVAAVSDTAKAEMEAAARGAAAAGPITFTSTSVAQGGTLAGTLANASTVSNVAVAGCGINNANVPVSGTGTFSLLVPASQAPGACNLVFTITNTDGTTSTQTVPVTVTATARGVTSAPDLVSAAIVAGTNNVLFTFDAPLASVVNTRFHVYDANGAEYSTATITSSGSTVTAQFLSAELAKATTATVDQGAVTDANGRPSPISAAALQTITLAIGTTDAPDLVSVGNPGVVAGATTFDFTFDAPVASPNNATGFKVVSTGGIEFGASSVTSFSVDKKTLTVAFDSLTLASVPASQVVRGVAVTHAVEAVGDATSFNPLETAKVGTLFSSAPDLTAVTVVGAGTVRYTFDQAVACGNALSFNVYDAAGMSGSETAGNSCAAVNGNANAVDIVFLNGVVANAVGANVNPGGVIGTTGSSQPNVSDELGLQSVTYQAGRTAQPDLVSVTKSTDAFGATTVKYTFDDPITTATAAQFFLYDATGAQFTGTGTAGLSNGNKTVTLSGFSAAQVAAAIIGAVDANSGVDGPGTPSFPEGATTITG